MFKVTARTVLELGSELISSDIIAFYELVKNAFDAKSKTGAEIEFRIVLRRNEYLRIRTAALVPLPAAGSEREHDEHEAQQVAHSKAQVSAALDIAAGRSRVDAFQKAVANATTVTEFITELDAAYGSLNTIEVRDAGTGMSADELTENYLTIGTPSRKREVDKAIAVGETRTPYLGEKGIGRLSAMRLGDRLLVETSRTQDTHFHLLELDWKRFSDLEAMLENIQVAPVLGLTKERKGWSGTRLVISDLTEDWSERRVRELADQEFARLTDPFVDPKNRPRIAIFWSDLRIAIPWMDRTLIDNAHASFKGKYEIINGEPQLDVRLEAFNLGFDHPREVDAIRYASPDIEGLLAGDDLPTFALTSVGPFSFEVYWYNRRYLAGIEDIGNQKVVRALQKKWSGILLFRDGFRVLPYGDDEDDWLGLDRKALGRSGYVLNKTQFVGHVQITRMANPGLVDQTNREGLRWTPEHSVLTAVLSHVVQDTLWHFFQAVTKQYKQRPLDLGDVRERVDNLETRAKVAITRVRRLVPKDQREVIDDIQHAFAEFHDLATRTQQRVEEVEAEGRQLIQMAGVGLMVEVIAHELARASESALASLERLRGKDVPAELRSKLETLRSEMKTVSKRLRVLDELSVSGRQRTEVFDLGELIKDLSEGHAAQFERHNIAFDVRLPKQPVRVKLVKGMVVQILENLLSNSVYWTGLRSSRETHYRPRIEIRVGNDPLIVRFADNGRGIAPDHRERVFRPFWSLKEKGKRRGLGLFIARENANHLGGSLTLSEKADEKTGRLHEFILELPDSARLK